MSESTKIEFRHRRIQQIADITDIVSILFPGSRKQRYAAACILFELKWADHIVPNLAYIETKCGISRRVLQRARAKLSRLGIIEHVGMLNSRHAGEVGWRLSGRFTAALRMLAAKLVEWQQGDELELKEKEAMLAALLQA
jgi:hypothetical protein